MNNSTGHLNFIKPENEKPIFRSAKTIALTDEAMIRKEMKLYKENKKKYLDKFEGKYIALLNGEVLDSDTTFSSLASRVYAQFGYRAIYMPLVTKQLRPDKIYSPKLKQK